MRNHNGRHPTAPRAHGVQDAPLGIAIHRAQRVVQQQNVRVAHQGARNGKPLSLPAGKGDAALADHGFPAALESQNRVMNGCRIGRFSNRRHRQFRAHNGHVLTDRS